MQTQISVSTVVAVLAAGAAAAVGFAFMWWGARKMVKMFMTAWKRGKVHI